MFKNDHHDEENRQLTFIKQSVIFHAKPAPREEFVATRWPYTYAADFVRAHEDIIPDRIWDTIEVSGKPSRSQASQARTRWANSLSLLDVDVADMLACGYIIENGVKLDAAARQIIPTWVHVYVTRSEKDEL